MDMDLELANVIYVFCPHHKKGVMFYDQSPEGPEALFAGSLRNGKFFVAGEKVVEWDETINGEREEDVHDYKVVKQTKLKVNGGSYEATTIMISNKAFDDLLEQLKNSVFEEKRGYKVIDLQRVLLTNNVRK